MDTEQAMMPQQNNLKGGQHVRCYMDPDDGSRQSIFPVKYGKFDIAGLISNGNTAHQNRRNYYG